ncbi:MAG: hypothetical protein HUU35_17915, partial [Armatimonadetes bacterium]|nr:hypothetical protein [Armatimonadota bacterium]
MPRWDRLELGLTLALPWFVFLFLAAVHAFLQTPRPTHSGASRLVVVGRPLTRRVPVLAENSAKPAAWLEQPTLFDLQRSDAVWLRRLGGGRVRREAISFGLTTLQEEVERLGLDTAGTDLEARVTFPVPEAAGARHLLVAVRPQRLFPLATWEVYAYRLRDGAPQPVLALRNQPEVIRIARAPDGRLAL